nr:NAD(P)H-dependent oxidoreductase [Bacillus subtilis]WGD74039.1 NAD(P)H-dependent oxidoreductase [Bacillus subtilis]
MIKIFVYVGTRNLESRILQYTKSILEKLSRESEIYYTIYTPFSLPLLPSTGCKNCFIKGECPNEEIVEDYGEKAKREILDSNILVIASPVYSHNVSSDIKILIDRLSFWGHIFRLVGKHVITIDSSESNGSEFVSEYLKKTFTFMGAKVSHQVSFVNSEVDIKDELILETVNKMKAICEGEINYAVSDKQEITYQTLKMILKGYDKDHFEYKYWKDSGMFESLSLKEWHDAKS